MKEQMGDAFKKAAKPTLTLKQMIRQLHISAPVFPVMSILGKKYPVNSSEWKK
jgi:hypothetical protein